ncbi:MAG: hypothetical protein ACK4QL_08135 [Pseudanabaenaceae cyanobacterium]
MQSKTAAALGLLQTADFFSIIANYTGETGHAARGKKIVNEANAC